MPWQAARLCPRKGYAGRFQGELPEREHPGSLRSEVMSLYTEDSETDERGWWPHRDAAENQKDKPAIIKLVGFFCAENPSGLCAATRLCPAGPQPGANSAVCISRPVEAAPRSGTAYALRTSSHFVGCVPHRPIPLPGGVRRRTPFNMIDRLERCYQDERFIPAEFQLF